MLSSATMQTKTLNWFSALESTNNVKYAGDGKFVHVPVCQKLSTHNLV